MDEATWLIHQDATPLLGFLGGAAGERELRLVASGFARNVWSLLWNGDVSRDAVEVAERYADGRASADELVAAAERVEAGLELYPGEPVYDVAYWACAADAGEGASRAAFYGANVSVMANPQPASETQDEDTRAAERRKQAGVVRDVFGPFPFHPVAFADAWRTPTAVAVARAIYDGRHFHDLPILADALEDAGCDAAEVLAHCRGGGVHVRGCWAVDLVLGRR